jgi:hypothetical protein
MTLNVFDQAARYAAKRLDPIGFLRWVVGAAVEAWRWQRWLPAMSDGFPGRAELESDAVAEFFHREGAHPPVALVVEFQSRPQGDMLERVAEYLLDVRRNRPCQTDPLVRYTVVGVVMNLTGPPQQGRWEMAAPDFADLGLQLNCRVLTLREMDGRALLEEIATGTTARCILPWFPLMRGGDDVELIARWRQVAEQEPDARLRGDYGGLALVFADLADRREVWEKGLEGWNVEVSQVVEKWKADARAEGLRQGRDEGLRQGRDEGILLARREVLLDEFRDRFSQGIPEEVREAINRQTDPQVLREWLHRVRAADTLEKACEAITKP